MSRPTTFDHDKVLDRAMLAFWTYGYASTSIDDLVKQTKLLRGSLYNTFGDKRALYIQTLKRYGQKSIGQTQSILNSSKPVAKKMRDLLMVIVDMTEAEKKRGSMLCSCIEEVVPHDSEVAGVVTDIVDEMKQVIETTLVNAQKAGELSPTTDPRGLTRYLASSVQGLCITAKAGAPRDELMDIVNYTLVPFE